MVFGNDVRRLALDRSSNNLVIVGVIRHGSVDLDDAGYDDEEER